MRVLLANLKALVAAEAAARAGRKPTKKDKDKGKGEKKKPKKADKAKGAKGTKTGGKRKKDPTVGTCPGSTTVCMHTCQPAACLYSPCTHVNSKSAVPPQIASRTVQSDRSMESLFAELAAAGVLRPLPHVELADYLGAPSFMGSTLERAGLKPDASMAQVQTAQSGFAQGYAASCAFFIALRSCPGDVISAS
jgi:hypothetical protein